MDIQLIYIFNTHTYTCERTSRDIYIYSNVSKHDTLPKTSQGHIIIIKDP